MQKSGTSAGSGRLRLPVRDEPAVALIDVGGGVVDVDAVRAFLTRRAGAAVLAEPVYGVDPTPSGVHAAAAGGARGLAAVVDRQTGGPADRPGTFQHQSGPGRWAVGGRVDPELTTWEVGRTAAVDASRAALIDYAQE